MILDAGRSEGDVEGYYLSPAIPAVGAHLEAVVRELVRGYAVDGLHLDFIRYPGPSFDYSRAALEGFRRARGGGSDALAGPARNPAAWDDYRRDVLTALATRLADAARAERPGVVISAAVAPDEAQAIHHKFQDWPRWLESGVIAALCPMTYTPDNRLFQQQLEVARERATRGQPRVGGDRRLPARPGGARREGGAGAALGRERRAAVLPRVARPRAPAAAAGAGVRGTHRAAPGRAGRRGARSRGGRPRLLAVSRRERR